MTDAAENTLREVLRIAGEAKAADVVTPDWDVLTGSSDTVGGRDPFVVRPPQSPRRRSLVTACLAAVAVAVTATILLWPSDGRGGRSDVDIAPGRAEASRSGSTVATTGAPSGQSQRTPLTTPSGSNLATSTLPNTTTPNFASPNTTASISTTQTTAPESQIGTWTDPGDRTGLIRCDAALASRSVGGDSCNRSLPEALSRPISLPKIAAGGACPVSTTYRAVLRNNQQFFGGGPLPVFPVEAGVLRFESFGNSRRWDAYWGGQKILFAAGPNSDGMLVRGRQLDGEVALGFGQGPQDEAFDEYHAEANPDAEWTTQVTVIRLRRPGCYGLQIDSADGTFSIVFRADGPTMPDPPPVG